MTRPVITGPDYFRSLERRLLALERRGAPTATSLMGPGIAMTTTVISDWNNPATLVNGFYSSGTGALNSPDGARQWIGYTLADGNGGGYQRVSHYNSNTTDLFAGWPPVTYIRAFQMIGQAPTFSAWSPEVLMTQVIQNADVLITDTSNTDIPWLTITEDVSSPDQSYLCMVSLDVEHTSTGNEILVVDLVVGGTVIGTMPYSMPGLINTRIPFTFARRVTGLSAGSTIFKVRAHLQTGTGSYRIRTDNSVFSVFRGI